MTHTPEKIHAVEIDPADLDWDAWELWPEGQDDESYDADPVATMVCGGDNAKRLVAAWNACAGIPTEELEAGVMDEVAEALGNGRSFARLFHDDAATACIEQIDRVLARPGETVMTRDPDLDHYRAAWIAICTIALVLVVGLGAMMALLIMSGG